jgi:uncharacterized glyoxalase superfamily protein PhnB
MKEIHAMVSSSIALHHPRFIFPVACLVAGLFFLCEAQNLRQLDNNTEAKTRVSVQFEHLAINVSDPEIMSQWYTKNLGMKLLRGSFAPNASAFIADSGMKMMMELLHNVVYPIFESGKIHHTSIHFAFSTPDIKETRKQLLAAGAIISDSLRTTSSGDQVLTLRDPWGFAIQFVERTKPLLNGNGLYPEHIGLNVADSRKVAAWYVENLDFIILREGSTPGSAIFISDRGKKMMYEFYQNKNVPIINFDTVSYQSFHIALTVNDIQEAKEALVASGAKVAEDMKKTASGDDVMMLRDPWGLPLQFVHRINPMLK